MHVVHVTGSLSRLGGGVAAVVRALARRQASDGIRITVCGLDDGEGPEAVPDSGPNLAIHAARRLGPPALGYAPDMRGILALGAAGADLVHRHGLWSWTGVEAARLATRRRIPLIVSPHGMLDPWALRHSRWKKRFAGWLFERRDLRRAACLHALCADEADAIRRYGLNRPIAVIPNGVERPAGLAGAPPPWAGRGSGGRRALLYLGRLHPKKGLPVLLAAWTRAVRDYPVLRREWILVIAGWDQGGHAADLRRLAEEAGVQDAVEFVGPVEGARKAAAYEHADAFVLPSLSEGFPVSVLEAWSYGLPVVMTPACHIPEGAASGAALVCGPEPKPLCRGLTELLTMPENQRREMGRKGRQIVEERFNWARIGRETIDLYRWVLGGGHPPPFVTTERTDG